MRRDAIVCPSSTVALLVGFAALCSACGGHRGFSANPPMWRDDGDFTPFAPMPAEYEASELWDTMENIFFGPLARLLRVNTASEASNVNAVDEVPDSSWFTNRIGKADMSIAELSRGPCQGPPLDPAVAIVVVKIVDALFDLVLFHLPGSSVR